jgi:hypothetical protein
MSQSCYIVAVWHHLKTENFALKIKQILHKIKQNTIAKKYRYIGIFFLVSVFVFFPNTATAYIGAKVMFGERYD